MKMGRKPRKNRCNEIEILLELRKLDLSKKPGLSELLDWVGYLEAVQTPENELDRLPYLGALLKQESDRKLAMDRFGLGSDS